MMDEYEVYLKKFPTNGKRSTSGTIYMAFTDNHYNHTIIIKTIFKAEALKWVNDGGGVALCAHVVTFISDLCVLTAS